MIPDQSAVLSSARFIGWRGMPKWTQTSISGATKAVSQKIHFHDQ